MWETLSCARAIKDNSTKGILIEIRLFNHLNDKVFYADLELSKFINIFSNMPDAIQSNSTVEIRIHSSHFKAVDYKLLTNEQLKHLKCFLGAIKWM